MNIERKIIIYSKYFYEFYNKQDLKTRKKIDFVIDLIRNVEKIPIKFLKYLKGIDGLYEIKVVTTFKSIRIFCFFDKEQLIILINCFVKKTKKTPKKEMELAKSLKKQYFLEKKGK